VNIEVRFRIPQGNFLLDIDLSLPGRGVTSLFGPSGSGKTTLLRALAGLERHPGGYLKFGEMVWQDAHQFLPPHRRPLGYVFQEASLFDHLDVRGNLDYGARRISAGRQRVSLKQAIELLEIGPLMDRKPATLSGGERQRVSIARALAVSPELLLMDEPLAAVDRDRRQEILPYIESLHRELDIPVVHVSHLPEEVGRLADHLVLLDKGRVVAAGNVQELFTRLDLAPSRDRDAASFIEARVSAHNDEYRLTVLEFDGGRFTVARRDLRRPLGVGESVRLRIAARDVSLTLERQTGTSILNILPVTIADISLDDEAQVTVRLMAGETALLARITRRSAHELGLSPGQRVYAQVKSLALLA
jgi:molybdate transport system ATP-binding protein